MGDHLISMLLKQQAPAPTTPENVPSSPENVNAAQQRAPYPANEAEKLEEVERMFQLLSNPTNMADRGAAPNSNAVSPPRSSPDAGKLFQP
eukprot:2573567-Rhodomonas_salina.1